MRKLKEIPLVNAFLEANANVNCQKHRRQILELFLRARVFVYFNQRSDEMNRMNAVINSDNFFHIN